MSEISHSGEKAFTESKQESVDLIGTMSEEELAAFKAVAEPAIVSLGKHFNVKESQAVEAYGHIMVLTLSQEALTFEKCQRFVQSLLLKKVSELNPTEGRLGLCLGLLRVKTKPFMSSTKQYGRNDPCPCGSGIKYKRCCLDANKKHEYEVYHRENGGL